MNIYNDFVEVEESIRENTPPIIYKYRDWENEFHKTVITKRELYLAHPHTLNDPLDLRQPYFFNTKLLTIDNIKQGLISAAKYVAPELKGKELNKAVNDRLRKILFNKEIYFQQNLKDFHSDKSIYDRIGVLSLCSSFDNDHVWKEYGNNHQGFAIGFETVELARELNCSISKVEYSDEPLEFIVLGDNSELFQKEMRRKTKIWEPEEEIRFLTFGIGINKERINKFSPKIVKEIVFGINTNIETQTQIIRAAKETIPDALFYKLKINSDKNGYEKEIIKPA
jgi:hypothetical protein